MTQVADPVERQVRAANNQSLFRAVNERLQELADTFRFVSETASFACECADTGCVAQMRMNVDEYEAVRASPSRFAVLPGHVYEDVEDVVFENERFAVVEKIGEGARTARELDPRSN